MKIINKILLMAIGVFALLLTGCSEDFPERTASPETDPNCAQVFFPNSNSKNLELELDATSIPITITRLNTTSAVVVPITVLNNTENIFVIPTSVSFASGESEISFDVTFPDAEVAVAYYFEIIIEGDSYIDHYTSVDGAASLALKMERIKWEKYAEGIYSSNYFGGSWAQTLYKAYGTNKFRFYDLWEVGYNWDFTWAGEASIIPGGIKNDSEYFVAETGFLDADYGMVSVETDGSEKYTFYDEETSTFTFDRKWTVALGSFGWYSESYEITELYQ